MARIVRYREIDQRLGNDSIYGSGKDGNMTLSTGQTYIMTRDMYFDNLTVGQYAVMFTNGFRLFVRNNLTLLSGARVGMVSNIAETVNVGTVVGRVNSSEAASFGVTKTFVLGESAAGTQVPDDLAKDLNFLRRGWAFDPTNGFKRVEGADDGDIGSDTAGALGGAPPQPPAGAGGAPGNPGNPGLLPPSSNSPGYSSTRGNAGNAGGAGGTGNPGNPGNPGNQGGTGAGGQGGDGGGLVVVIAKNIVQSSGTGQIISQGRNGYAGTQAPDGNPGNPGNPGNQGNTGNDGTDGNQGSNHAGHHAASTQNPPVTNASGHNPATENFSHHNTTVPGNPNHAQAHGGATVAGYYTQENRNPPFQYHVRSNYHHNNGHAFDPIAGGPVVHHHSTPKRSNHHYVQHEPGAVTGYYTHANYNPNHNHHYVSGHNPSNTHGVTNHAGHTPGNVNYTTNPGSHNPAVTFAAVPGGAGGTKGFGGVGGAGGAGGDPGLGGAGGLGAPGDPGLTGGIMIVTDNLDSAVSIVGSYNKVLINT